MDEIDIKKTSVSLPQCYLKDNFILTNKYFGSVEKFKLNLENFKIDLLNEKNGNYLYSNFENLIDIKKIYSSEFLLDESNRIFTSSAHTNDESICDKTKYENVQLILIKKNNTHLNGIVKSMEKFFKYYIKRRDVNGNLMMRGVLNCLFSNFENYFQSKFKCLNNIEAVQIEIVLFKQDLFHDYSEVYDRTNLQRDEMKLLTSKYYILDNLRQCIQENRDI